MNENGSSGFLLEAQNITKMFGDLCANDDVTLALKPGEIHALLGENGAGKSTLVKIIYGSLQPTMGKLVWKGKPISVANPAIARTAALAPVTVVIMGTPLITAVARNLPSSVPGPLRVGVLMIN